MTPRISFTTTNSALPSAPRKLRRARHGVGASRAMQAAREDGLFWGVIAVAVVIAALVYAGRTIAVDIDRATTEQTRMSAQRAARLADAYYTAPPCIDISSMPVRKAYRQADIDRLCRRQPDQGARA